ncbi:uncharacterized protein LOC106091749 isoform X1 [Stomoxys calcitrans]|uniref:uncharacterized protein LOC106091749 isoform X1 n=1 Tax=Stomoxys calcitrans TaxID=35570 RepID=UPI0027E33A5D|nr:uncharacterized protein LOC106091749 isoform X1 [Stomoxys calcitrans]
MLRYHSLTVTVVLILGIVCIRLEEAFGEIFEENIKFCLRTEPRLLSDIEKHKNPLDDNAPCEIIATTLTSLEKESFRNTMCKDHGSTHKDAFYFLKMYNGNLIGRGQYHEICHSKTNPLMAWIPYDMMQQYYAQYLDPKDRINYMAKATDVSREKTELCHFRHSDLVNHISDNLFTCVVMIFEDNFYGLESSINVLVEIKPLMYELRNITYLPWVNSSLSYKTLLGKTALKNPSREQKQIYGSFNYEYVEKVVVNLSSVYKEEGLLRLPILFEHKNAVLKLDDKGIGGMDVTEKAYFGRKMDPKTKVRVDLIGQWAEHQHIFNADIYEYFGSGIKRFHDEMKNGNVSFMRIDSTEPVYEMPEPEDIVVAHLHSLNGKLFQRLTEEANETDTEADDFGDVFEDDDEEMHVEGLRDDTDDDGWGLYPWFVLILLAVGGILLAAIYGTVQKYSDKREPRKYKFTGVATK